MSTPTPRTAHPFKMSNQVPPVIPPLEPHGQSARCAVAMGSAWWATPRTNQEDKIIRHYCDISWQERYDLMRDHADTIEREANKMRCALLSARGGLCVAAIKDGTLAMVEEALSSPNTSFGRSDDNKKP